MARSKRGRGRGSGRHQSTTDGDATPGAEAAERGNYGDGPGNHQRQQVREHLMPEVPALHVLTDLHRPERGSDQAEAERDEEVGDGARIANPATIGARSTVKTTSALVATMVSMSAV